MFGPVRGPWGDEQWRGWWGDDPPFHHPVFVLTHLRQASIAIAGGPVGYECVEFAASPSVMHVRFARTAS